MLQAAAVAGGLGYLGSQLEPSHAVRPPQSASYTAASTGDTIAPSSVYASDRVRQVQQQERRRLGSRVDAARHPYDTQVVTPGFNRMATDQELHGSNNNTTHPLPFATRPDATRGNHAYDDERVGSHTNFGMHTPLGARVETFQGSGGGHYAGGAVARSNQPPAAPAMISSLSGQTISASDFTHNNMVPFYGSQVRQNTSSNAHQSLLEVYTGTPAHETSKREIAPLFNPRDDVSFTQGAPVYDSGTKSRYHASAKRQSERPMEQIRVGPGLNQGYEAAPVGGFQQFEARNHAMPRTVDELRAKNNPKVTYKAPVIPGKGITQRGRAGEVFKNRPDRYFVNSPARYNTTVGAVKGRTQRPAIVDRETNRQCLTREHAGAAGPTQHVKHSANDQAYAETFRQQLDDFGVRNAGDESSWEYRDDADYGKTGMEVRPNERDTTQLATYVSNAVSAVKAITAPLADLLRTTRKENVIGNARLAGNMQVSVKKAPVHDPNQTARTTLKESNIHNRHEGFMGSTKQAHTVFDPVTNVARTTIKQTNIHNAHEGHLSGPKCLTVYDPNDVARTTIKEGNIHDARTGAMQTSQRAGAAYDPNDVARTTIKEGNIHDTRTGAVQTSQRAGAAYDPNDVARTTIKEGNIHDTRTGAMQTSQRAGAAYDPNDVARTTVKEGNIHDARTGAMQTSQRAGAAFDPNDVARTTIKEGNIHDTRTGAMQTSQRAGATYDPNDVARTTIKEGNIHDTRTGNIGQQPSGAGDGSGAAPIVDPSDVAKATGRETLDTHDPARNMASGVTKGKAHDPNDKLRVTVKETVVTDTRTGNVSGLDDRGKGYLTNPKNAPATNRQFTSDTPYAGDADGPEVGGYQVAEDDAPDTNRQFTSDVEYSGNAGATEAQEPMSYEAIYNATLNEVKEEVALGRSPTQTGVKVAAGGDKVRMEIRKVEQDRENQRDFVATHITDLGPARAPSQSTREKDTLDREGATAAERQDPELLDAFHNNPFSKPLNSSA